MDLKEQDTIREIKKNSKDIKVPEGLQPEQIEQQLKGMKKRPIWKRAYTYGLATACVLAIVGIAGLQAQKLGRVNNQKKSIEKEEKSFLNAGNKIVKASDYNEVYKYVKTYEKEMQASYKRGIASYDTEVAMESAAPAAGSAKKSTSEGGAADFSTTNVRQEGVGEADIVKTDGKYIYTMKNNHLIEIVNVKKDTMEKANTIELGEDVNIFEFYVEDEKLVLLYTISSNETTSYYQGETRTVTYDITDGANPKRLGEIKQTGDYKTSRKVGDYVYTLSTFYAHTSDGRGKIEAYIPEVQNIKIPEDCIYMPMLPSANVYTVISTMDISNPDEVVDNKAILSKDGMIYVSDKAIYMCESAYEYGATTQSSIRKINYQQGKLDPSAQGVVPGTLDDSFSIDEYEGNLRLVTTVSASYGNPIPRGFFEEKTDVSQEEVQKAVDTNSLYVLDETLNIIGKIEGLAKDERIYSARFMGETGYFVTFRQVDPLFSVDLSNPKAPKIVGELKIPGFSEYLHPYGDGLLLGIGQEMDEEGMEMLGVKLSMFDISDPNNVKEVHKEILNDVYNADVLHDYKAALIDVPKNRIGFVGNKTNQYYYLFSYDKETGFHLNTEKEINTNYYGVTRGVTVNETLYLVQGSIIESYSLKDYAKIDDIIL